MGIIGTPCDGLIGGIAGHHVGSKLNRAIQAIQGGIFRCGLDAGGLDGVHRHFTAGGLAIVALGGDGGCTKTDRLDHAVGNGGNGGVAGTPGKGLVGGVAGRDCCSQGLGRAGAGKAQAGFIQADARNCNSGNRHGGAEHYRAGTIAAIGVIVGVNVGVVCARFIVVIGGFHPEGKGVAVAGAAGLGVDAPIGQQVVLIVLFGPCGELHAVHAAGIGHGAGDGVAGGIHIRDLGV